MHKAMLPVCLAFYYWYINMIRLFYNSETGVITNAATAKWAISEGTYIDVPQEINIAEWRVNVETRQLEPI